MSVGCVGSSTFHRRTQPHGQPNDEAVNVPYTSSIVYANGRPKNGTAEWLSAQAAAVWPAHIGPVPQVGNGTGVSRLPFKLATVPDGMRVLATSPVSRMAKPPRRYARDRRGPSQEGGIE